MNSFNIEKYIDEFTELFLPNGWVWRKGQIEIIKQILETYINKTHKVVVCEMPTGSGKSICAMCCSWIINNKLNSDCYILASDISLQEQYEKDLNRFNFNWGSVKGIDNYTCIDNGEKNSIGTCRIKGRPPKQMRCYIDCPYYCARQKAADSQTSVLNYAYWLIMLNYIYAKNKDNNGDEGSEILFKPRSVVFCDEAHKVLDIVQNHFSPKFDTKTLEKLERLTEFYKTYKVNDHTDQFKLITKKIKELYKEDNQNALLEILSEIEIGLEQYLPSHELLKSKIKEHNPGKTVAKEWRDAARLADWLKDQHCKLEDYVDIIESTSARNIIKNPQGDNLVFNCLQEHYLMSNYFNKWCNFTIFMSATISDASQYLKSVAIPNAKFIKMDSLFDFEKSPIKYYPGHKMNYKELNNNLPWLYTTISKIAAEHKNENGIIHSASYDLALKIFTNVDRQTQKRLLVYNGTEEKRDVLEQLKRDKNKILLGPSILEGIDLKDDWSRFQIFAKVPYLSLADKYVEAKMKLNPQWYQYKAILNILQGVGRSVRNEKDYAITYILDACFGDLLHYNRKSFPAEFIDRILVINN